MAQILYEDDTLRVWNDGTEEAFFTDEQWAEMLSDPAYGYICQAGKHRIDGGERNWSPAEGCMSCFAESEAWEPSEASILIHARLVAKPRPMFEVIASFVYDAGLDFDDLPF